ncbi:SagB/ThcOx family dehydrogenase [Priestia megaterium]|uniref:SagB/ThcOx family dehydrogenase n=1 Tax=Priestia megaterium TaxID=1404 RepID=UPI001868C97B|nr:SagB/ThcOx family dehydrogenase [Priestia megaterium]MBE2975817.1 SagB/ThcOx family dehydrogenase [Priestia megaterium]
MQFLKKKIKKKKLNELVVYWSPSVIWSKNNGEVKIDSSSYSGFVVDIFPEFYEITEKGISIKELFQHYSYVNSEDMEDFVVGLLSKRVLVDSLLTPKEVFGPQEKLFQNPYSEDTFLDPHEYKEFKKSKLNRQFENHTNENISLIELELPKSITERRSYRIFNEQKKISFPTFSLLFNALKQERKNGSISYNYASPGGLYPIDIFIYVKSNRIENVEAGLYYYNPIKNQLQAVSKSCVITKDNHYQINKDIFNSSAFSIFLVYDASVTMPKYKGMGYFYASIEVGIIVSLLTQVAELNGIGLCSVGEMDFEKISKYFKLNKNQVFLHSIEVGLKP